MENLSTMHKAEIKSKRFIQLQRLLLCLLVFIAPKLLAQTSPSGQVKFITPTTLSACSNDTVCIQLTNLKGAKGVTYTGNTTISVNIPGGALIRYLDNSVTSTPAGATQVSYASNVLTLSIPLPSTGTTTKICFVIMADCKVSSLSTLPKLTGTITYPAGFPITTENFASSAMNVGVGNLVVQPYGTYFSPTADQTQRVMGAESYSALFIANSGYGDIRSVRVTRTVSNVLGADPNLYTASNPGWSSPSAKGVIQSTTNDGTNTTTVYLMTDTNDNTFNFGPDHKLAAGQAKDRLMATYFTTPNQCVTGDIKYVVEWICADGSPSCQAPQTFIDHVVIGGGTPKLDGTLVSAEKPDGCPNKQITYKVKNNGVGNAAPVGNAYDVTSNINFGGGLITISNLTVNGVPVPNSLLFPVPGLNANNFTINWKDKNTNPAFGLEDADGDGFYDDMKVGTEITISFKYTIPCKEACGANLYYQFASNNTFTDFCRTLKGVTYTSLLDFGFQQVVPISQKLPTPDYGVWTVPADTKTKTANFDFQYQQYNLNLTNATAKLVINYSARMEVNPATIKINGVAPTNAPVLVGIQTYTPVYGPTDPFTAAPYQPYSYANGATDTDSAYVVTLTAAELASLFDGTPDNLQYDATYYGCGKRQNQNNTDSWQILVSLQSTLCTDGSTPCAFDLACKKPYSYSSGSGCIGKPCFISDLSIARTHPVGGTDATLTTPSLPDSSRSYEGDTVTVHLGNFISSKSLTPIKVGQFSDNQRWQDGRMYFSVGYSKPKGWNENYNIFDQFVANGSEVVIHSYTPNPSSSTTLGTVGPAIFTAPILLQDYKNGASYAATNMGTGGKSNSYTWTNGYPGSPSDYCVRAPTVWYYSNFCPLQNSYWYSPDAGAISNERYINVADDKISELYFLVYAEALERAGWNGDLGDPNIYIEIRQKFRMNPNFPWDNSNDWKITGGLEHYGNGGTVNQYSAASDYYGSCNIVSATHLTVTKEEYIANPNAVYNPSCTMRADHQVFFKSYQGDYFNNGTGEVRVPFKVDSIVVDVPTEYALSNISLLYNQSCTVQTSTAIVASATTGHVRFTNSAGGDFPRADDCSGNKIAYDLSYDLTKTGTAAPTTYALPIKIYTRDEFGNVKILTDTAYIAEAKPVLTLTPITPVLNNSDGGTCQPAYFDFKIQNNSLYAAPNVYLAAESGSGTTIVNITDFPDSTYANPIVAGDVSTYGTNNRFAQIGTIGAGDIRIIRVYAKTNICADNFKVYADYGCSYPSPLQPNLSSATLLQTTASYVASAPNILARVTTNALNITELCTDQTVELEIRNANLANIYKLLTTVKIPAAMRYVASSAQIQYPASTGTYTPITNVTVVGTDSLRFDLSANAPFTTACGLTGSDTITLNNVRIKFTLTFIACPTTSIDQLLFNVSGENYCGTKSVIQYVLPVNYVGSSGTQNNYTFYNVTQPLVVCAAKNQTQAISDIIYIKNIGGYGTASGATSGKDSVTITIPFDVNKLVLSNFTVGSPFSNPIFGSDPSGNTTISLLIPAGLAIGDSIALPINYDLLAKMDKLCLADNTPLICYFGLFSSPVILECATKGLNCGGVSKNLRGSGISLRSFDCCYGSIGDYVWTDANKDGQQGSTTTEPPIAGVKVYLLDATTGAKLDSTVTDANGKYLFDSLFTNTYKVEFIKPLNYIFTNTNIGSILTDSDPNTSTGITHTVSISTLNTTTKLPLATSDTLRNNPQIDAGFVAVGSIGDLVWKDTNSNGIQDAGEIGVDGVKVILWNSDAAGNPTTKVDSTITASGGKYLFSNLSQGDYVVQFVKASIPPTCAGFTSLDTSGAGINGTNNSDANTTSGFTAKVSLAPVALSASSSHADSLNTNNLNIDAGLVKCYPPNYTVSATQPTCSVNGNITLGAGTIGDKVAYSIGTTFTGTYASATLISTLSGGIILGNIAVPTADQTYTIRVFSTDSCFVDTTIIIKTQVCCSSPNCGTVTVKKN